MPKISVIVPVYKVEEYLDLCLDSILNQTFEDFELICINDGSPDCCPYILEQYSKLDKRIKVFSQKNQGLSVARNKGIEKASGEYITFVDSDDYLSPISLELWYKNITQYNSDFVYSYSIITNGENGMLWEMPKKQDFLQTIQAPTFNEKDLDASFYPRFLGSAWAKLYRKDFIKDFKFPAGLIFEDMPFFAKCFLNANRISYILEPLYYYRKNDNSIINNGGKNFLDLFKINELVTAIFKDTGKYEKYKTILLTNQMEGILLRTQQTQGEIQKKMFNLLKETYRKIIFDEYDYNILNSQQIYWIYKEILQKDYKEFKVWESRFRNAK